MYGAICTGYTYGAICTGYRYTFLRMFASWAR